MGLDMYAFSVHQDQLNDPDQQVDLEIRNGAEKTEFYYWRKFNNLHGWMHKLYVAKGGKDPEFNCNSVRLTDDDLNRLIQEANPKDMPATSGFFFGELHDLTDADKECIQSFVATAKEKLSCGYVVYYYSWW